MKRISVVLALLLASVIPAKGQGTVMPIPLAQWFDNTGLPLSAGGMCVFAAGSTSTLRSTYTTAALTVANSNPILFNAAGRPTSGGVFLTPGTSYKFILKDFTGVVSPTCVPDTGTTIWSVDNVSAVPGSAAAVDVVATAGESIAAGDAVFISTGAGSLNAGQIYKTDADLLYRSTAAVMVGMAESAIASGATGTVRISGAVTTASSVSTGSPYYLSATAGAVTVTPPTNAVRIGIAVSSTSIVLGMTDTPVGPRGPPCGRLTLTSNTPVTTSDVTAATTVYYTPYGGCNQVSTFDGTAWTVSAFSQLSIAVPATTATVYDVFIYDNAGALALELTAWTNDTTRATALTTQNGVYVKTGALTRLYLGSFRTTGVSGQTADAAATRLLWNYFNRVERPLSVLPTTDSWTYTTATWRQANNSTANQVAVMVGVAEDAIALDLMAHVQSDTLGRIVNSAIGEDSTTTPLGVGGGGTISYMNQFVATYMLRGLAQVRKIPAAGYHFYAWLEYSGAGGTTTWYGDVGLPTQMQSGLVGTWKC